MKSIFLFSAVFILFTGIGFSQSTGKIFSLTHLAKEAYVKKIELTTEQAYLEYYGLDIKATYTENSYDWIVSIMNKAIEKDFAATFTKLSSPGSNIITYSISFDRHNETITWYLDFESNGTEIGRVAFLSGILGKHHTTHIKLYNCKKQIKQLFNDLK